MMSYSIDSRAGTPEAPGIGNSVHCCEHSAPYFWSARIIIIITFSYQLHTGGCTQEAEPVQGAYRSQGEPIAK